MSPLNIQSTSVKLVSGRSQWFLSSSCPNTEYSLVDTYDFRYHCSYNETSL